MADSLFAAPLTIGVEPRSPHATDLVVAVTCVRALERVAPFALIELGVEAADVMVAGDVAGLGVLADGDLDETLRAGRIARGSIPTPLTEDDHGRWFRADAEGQRVEVRDLDPWALVGIALDASLFRPTTDPGVALDEVLRLRVDTGAADRIAASVRGALAWAAASVDAALGSLAARDPARVRRWIAEVDADRTRLRAAHDALRARYDRDLELVATPDTAPEG